MCPSKNTLDPYDGEITDVIAKVIENTIMDVTTGPKAKRSDNRIMSVHGQSKKSLGRVVAHYNALHRPQGNARSAGQIRQQLPAMLRDMDQGDLAKVLKTPIFFGTLSHLKQKKPDLNDDYSDTGGRPSFYKDKSLLEKVVKNFLTRPGVQETLDSYLFESGMLYQYYKWSNMRNLVLTRQNNAAVENNIKLFADMQDKYSEFNQKSKREEYQRICRLSEEELETEAAKKAEISLKRHKGNHISFVKEQAAALVFRKIFENHID